MSTNVAMTVLLAVVCGGAAMFGAGKTWAEEKTRHDLHSMGDVWDLTTDAAVVALVWAFVAFLALVVALGVFAGISALV